MTRLQHWLSVTILLSWFCFGRSQVVDTKYGKIRGATINVLNKEVDVFYGIPFAKPPVDSLRFKHSLPPDPWSPDVKYATQEKPSCLQPLDAFVFLDDYRQTPRNLSEDCLYLNLWRASNVTAGSNLPVMFYIYGGGWSTGSSMLELYNGKYLAVESGVIVVSANYRLGALGFGYYSPDTIPGNMGLLDQVMALKWTQGNIGKFGGDPGKVTIFGQSAGAVAVGLHLLSPLSHDIFKYAILESGAPVQTFGRHSFLDRDTARSAMETFASHVGCQDLGADLMACLQSVDPEAITPAFMKGIAEGKPHAPVIDKYFLHDDPSTLMATGQFKKTNIMLGFTKDEATVLMYPILQNLTRDGVTKEKYEEILPMYIRLPGPKYKKEVEAMRLFYRDLQDPLVSVDYINILNRMRNDMDYTCRAITFSSYFAEAGNNSSYMYSFNHHMSTSRYPLWIGATHSYELEFVFGLVLNQSLKFNQEEVELCKTMMTYWTNFAKSGNPNLPIQQKTKWSPYDGKMKDYLNLETGLDLATRRQLRHQQCNFINYIIPLIGEEEQSHKGPGRPVMFPNASSGYSGTVVVITMFNALAWFVMK